MSWAFSILLLMILTWTLWPSGLAAIFWSTGHAIGQRLAKRAFGNPTGEIEQNERASMQDESR